MFRRLLIANRGEIALRIVRAAKKLGVQTVVAHSEADRDAPWLRRADATVCIGPARAADSYLNAGAVLQAAELTECQAIHPGYGFLAENAVFAARCEQQGITFVGPGADAIRRMGDKARAREAMRAAGVPTIPGSSGLLQDAADARRVADEVGYPVLLKARAGGGGRGLRVCRDPAGLAEVFGEAARESEAAFGDGGLYLEKFLEGARHVEFQVLCDAFGSAVHLGERDCSVQRKHQKLVEESPSPAMSDELRARLGERVARAVAGLGYRNAGTVEFLFTGDGDSGDGEGAYFMEMNTRLQVEHPVTEMVTGLDLVALQLRLAANQPLGFGQEAVTLSGHAIELRVNAENPDDGFRPDPGTIGEFTPPPERAGEATLRWDSAIESGYRLPPHYDSMIGKLVAHAGDRAAAVGGARAALQELRVEGIHTTLPLHARILDDDEFAAGTYDLRFLERLLGSPG